MPSALHKNRVAKKPDTRGAEQLLQQVNELVRKQRYEEALPGLTKLVSLDPKSESARYHQALALAHCGRAADAHASLRKLLKINAENRRYLELNANILYKLDRNEKAKDIVTRLLEADPENVSMLTLLAQLHRKDCDVAGAHAALTRVLEIDADNATAHYHYSLHCEAPPRGSSLKALERVLDNPDIPAETRSLAGFALGNYAFNRQDDEAAFRAFERANLLLYRTRSASFPSPTKAFQMWGGSGMTREYYEGKANWGIPDRLRLFIVGGSRGGKSLVETLAGLHPDIDTGGENLEFIDHVRQVAGKNVVGLESYLNRLTRGQCKRDAKLVRERAGTPAGKLLTNTLPENIWTLPVIALWFPQTPIIFCRRAILDHGISIYFRRYQTKNRDLFDIDQIGYYLRDINNLIDFYLQTLPNPMLELQYEDNVRDPIGAARRIYAFLGLDAPADLESRIKHEDETTILNPGDSIDGLPMVSDQFVGIGERFSPFLQIVRD